MMVTNAPDRRIVGIGELLWDLLPAGARLGGTVTNFAVLCARLGNKVALASSVGDDDYGRTARGILFQPNLDLQQLQTDRAHPTGTVDVTLVDSQPTYVIHRGVAWDFIRPTQDLLAVARATDAVCFGTLAQRHEVSRATIRNFIDATPARCVRVFDINIRMPDCTAEVLRWSMAHATILKVSDEELPLVSSLLGEQVSTQWLLENFPKCALVATTFGAHGSLLTTREGESRHPGFPIKLVDTVGAGDAFTAGLIHAYLRGASLQQMSEIGNLCGSYVAGQAGATPPLSAELIGRIQAVLGAQHDASRAVNP